MNAHRPFSGIEASAVPEALGGTNMVERVLDGRYALEMLVGSGGMADVYRAKDQLL